MVAVAVVVAVGITLVQPTDEMGPTLTEETSAHYHTLGITTHQAMGMPAAGTVMRRFTMS